MKTIRSKKADAGTVYVIRKDAGNYFLRGAATLLDLSGKGVIRSDAKLGTLRSDTRVLRGDYRVVANDFRKVLGEELERVRKESDARRR